MSIAKILKNKYLWIFLIIIVAGAYIFSRGNKLPNYEFAIAKRGNIVREVDVTGKIKPAQNIDLAFEKSGKVVFIGFAVNDKVAAGQVIAQLNNSDILAQYNQALASVESAKALELQYEASLDSQKAKLEELKRGTRIEDIEVKRAELENSKQTLANYYNEVVAKLQYAYNLSDEAVRVKTSALFNGSKAAGYKLSYSTCDSSAQSDAENLRAVTETEFETWLAEINSLDTSSTPALDAAFVSAKTHLAVFQKFLERLSNTLTVGCNITNSSFDTYRTNVTTGRSNIVTATNTILTQQNYISSQKTAIQKIENELNLKLAGSTAEQIAAQEATVKQAEASFRSQSAQIKYAQANVQNLLAQMSKNVMIAPISGIITKIDPKVGEIVIANTSVVSIITEPFSAKGAASAYGMRPASGWEIEANIPEVDITKVKIEDAAKVTLDAYGDDVNFPARVKSKDEAEIMIEGVPTYKVTLQFNEEDPRIKSGMTANITITTDKKESVIVIPQRAVISQNGDKIVKMLISDNQDQKKQVAQEIKVITGLRGSDGNIEIIDGIKEGDRVITFMEEK